MGEREQVFTIRAAADEDSQGILECLALAFAPYRDAYTSEAFLDTVLTAQSVLDRMAQMSIFVATDVAGKVVGTIACKVTGEARGHLRGMAVRPEYHGSGLSARLLQAAEEKLRSSNCKRVTLNTTEPLKRASRFYQKYGYQPTGKLGSFFGMSLIEHAKSL
jgi:GNAT superfamily N-acetyltransferase